MKVAKLSTLNWKSKLLTEDLERQIETERTEKELLTTEIDKYKKTLQTIVASNELSESNSQR